MNSKEIKITVDVGDNLQDILKMMLKEIHTYSSAKTTNEGLQIVIDSIQKLLNQTIEEVKKQGYYDIDAPFKR